MRQFTLINANGEQYNLTERKKFLHSVKGLGFEEDNTYKQVGNKYVLLRNKKKQGEIEGQIHFNRTNAQAEYENFVKFTQLMPITLMYKPLLRPYYRKGTITKVEFDETDPLTVNVTFTATTPFFERLNVITDPADEPLYGKQYDYTYPYTYSSAIANTVIINVDTALESPCKLTMYGPLVNPTWRHYINNQLHSTGGIQGTIPAGNRLVIDTTGDIFTMQQLDAANVVVADMYQASDFGTERAIYLQRGTNRISIEDDNNNKVTVTAEAEINYASV